MLGLGSKMGRFAGSAARITIGAAAVPAVSKLTRNLYTPGAITISSPATAASIAVYPVVMSGVIEMVRAWAAPPAARTRIGTSRRMLMPPFYASPARGGGHDRSHRRELQRHQALQELLPEGARAAGL